MLENAKARPITIDLNQFKLHIALKNRIELTLHFNSPSRRFYLSVIALVVNDMKRQGKITSIPLGGHHDLLALLNETIGGSAGSSEEENLLPRIYKKWQHALPNLEEAPLFMVLGRKKGYEEGIGKTYPFTDAEKDNWANLFEYKGSHENVRLKFAIDKIGATLNDIAILYDDSLNGEAWDRFLSNLKGKGENAPEIEAIQSSSEVPASPMSPVGKQKATWQDRRRWVALIAMIVVFAGATTLAIWKLYPKPVPVKRASLERMAFPLPDKPSIAVLPFVNMSDDPKQEFFSDGLTEEIITALSKSQNVFVIARTSTFAYKGKNIRIDEVAEELGVRYVLEGSVRRAGDRIRINAQLVDATTGNHLWAERYDGTMDDVFALQDKITEKIVTALAVTLTVEEQAGLTQKGTNNVAAYEEFLKGWEHYLRFTSVDVAMAVQSFKKAAELDPNYGRAYAALALTYWKGSNAGAARKGLGVPYIQARLLARRYLEESMKNPTSIAHLVNSQFYLFRRQHEEAISELERALVLEPNNPSGNALMGGALFFSGKPNEAIPFINRAMRLDPHNPSSYLSLLGGAQFCLGNLQEAANLVEKGLKLNPERTGSAGWLVAIYGLLGREQEARAALDIYRRGWENPNSLNIQDCMYYFPFKNRVVADRFAEGMIRGGVPGRPSGYLQAYKENQMNGKEIASLLLDSTITGISRRGSNEGMHWWNDRKKNGDITYRGPEPITSDTGKCWLEGDTICNQYQRRFSGLKFCSTVFRNPKGTYAGKDEYFFCNDMDFSAFSLVR